MLTPAQAMAQAQAEANQTGSVWVVWAEGGTSRCARATKSDMARASARMLTQAGQLIEPQGRFLHRQ